MKDSTHSLSIIVFISLLTVASGCISKRAEVQDPTDLKGYIEDAHKQAAESKNEEGSLWISHGYRSDLFRDPKARFVNDVVTIQVLETTQALASADANNSRASEAQAGFEAFFGLDKKIKELPAFLKGTSNSSFEGEGSTSRQTTLRTSLTARVVDVLPNGYLVVEGFRDIHLNDENQSVYLSGVVRPEDIGPGNVVLSTSIAQMSVRVRGEGVVSQPIKPGWLYRILNGVLPF